jgi:sulfite exporter TauE/SafE
MITSGEWLGWLGGALLLGLLGSGHCLGMCGGIASALGMASRDAAGRARPQQALLHSAGRITSYGLLGATLGGLGHATHALLGLGPGLRMLAGLLVIVFGVQLMGVRLGGERLERLGLSVWRRLAPLGARIGQADSVLGALLLGGLWGFLPCGLVYSAAAAATATGSALAGAGFMMLFGVGTLPALLLASSTASGLGELLRRRPTRRLAGALMVLFGCWSIWGGIPGGHGGHGVDGAETSSPMPHEHAREGQATAMRPDAWHAPGGLR